MPCLSHVYWNSTVKPTIHWRLSPICYWYFEFVVGLSKVDCCRLVWLSQLCQFCRGQHCHQSWTYSTRSTLPKVGNFCHPNVERPFGFVTSVYGAKATCDFPQSPPCRILLCRQCIPGFSLFCPDNSFTRWFVWKFSVYISQKISTSPALCCYTTLWKSKNLKMLPNFYVECDN